MVMDRISRHSVWFGNLRVATEFIADYMVLLASSSQDFQHILEWFESEREVPGMKVHSSKPEAMVLNQKNLE